MFKSKSTSQVCIINADGTGFRRLTTDDTRQHYYPSLSPDGRSVIYSAPAKRSFLKFMRWNLASGNVTQLTNKLGGLGSPEISPDGKSIVFQDVAQYTNKNFVWWMERNGEDADKVALRRLGPYLVTGWGIYFVCFQYGRSRSVVQQPSNGNDLHKVNSLFVGGRADWSPDGQWIVTYTGDPGNREVYIMTADG